ncbi:MAG: ATP-binding protein [Actinomycetota bacterium]
MTEVDVPGVLRTLSDTLDHLGDPSAIADAAVRFVASTLGVDRARWIEITESTNAVRIEREQRTGAEPPLTGNFRVSDHEWVIADLRRDEAVAIPDVAASARVPEINRAFMATMGMAAYAIVPLVRGGVLVGALSVAHSEPRAWSATDLAVLRSSADRVWAAIERVRPEVVFREDLDLFRRFGDASPDILWVRDAATLRFRFLSRSLEAVSGIARSTVMSLENPTNWFDVVVPEDRNAVREALDEARSGRSAAREYRLVRPDGETRWLRMHAFALPGPGGTIDNLGGITSDVTAEKQAEMALVEQARQVRASEARNRALAERLEDFIATMAHELRNPVGALRTTVDLIDPDHPDAAIARARGVLDRQVRHLTRLLDDLLDAARTDPDPLSLVVEPVDLTEVARAAVEMNQDLIGERGHRVEVAGPVEPVVVPGDSQRLTQAVVNLVRNACLYTEAGGTIRVRCRRERDEAVLEVVDDGIGMRPETVERLFRPYARSDEATVMARSGMGIGLHLVQRIVERHHGRVTAYSDGPGLGSTFAIHLPALGVVAARPSVAEHPSAPTSPDPAQGNAVRRRRVLLVEDDPDLGEVMALLLAGLGHDVVTASTGAEALAAFAAAPPDVVLLDLGLPDITGFELARRLRACPDAADVVLVALSGWGGAGTEAEARAAGIDHHLTKPATREQLAEILLASRRAR